jgi:PIN domain nuclease of toxin-antitoxin system
VEALIYLDTHVVAWLYSGATQLLSAKARAAIDRETLLVSPMAVLELEFLREIGRLTVGADAVVEELRRRIGLEVCDLDFARVVASARALTWTRDPFDRVIVGHAVAADRVLLTKDRSIRRRFRAALW